MSRVAHRNRTPATWRTCLPNTATFGASTAHLLDTLQRQSPMRGCASNRRAFGRWLFQANDAGVLADDSVLWLYHTLLDASAPR